MEFRNRTERRSLLTTHAGSLPRPEQLREAWSRQTNDPQQEAVLQTLRQELVGNVVAEQAKVGVDIPNDGEFGKPMCSASDLAAWGTYIFSRLSGFGPTAAGTEAPAKAVSGQPMRIVGLRWEQREFPGFYAEYASGIAPPASRPSCLGPIAYCGEGALHRDLANLKIATDVTGVKEAFVTSIAVGSLKNVLPRTKSTLPDGGGLSLRDRISFARRISGYCRCRFPTATRRSGPTGHVGHARSAAERGRI